MAKFNKKKVGEIPTETNHMGAPSFQYNKKLEIAGILLCSFAEDSYYRSATDEMKRLEELVVSEPDKEFIAKAAVFARTVFGMRSITHAIAAMLAHHVKGEKWSKKFFNSIVYRVDDITEILSRYISFYNDGKKTNKKLPNSMKRGLRNAFGKFNAYQLGKYRSSSKEMSLVDAVNILHPKPSIENGLVEIGDNQQSLRIPALEALMTNKLRAEDTWEYELSKAGPDPVKKAVVWKSLITTHKLGYMATLRNLRNIMEQAPDMLDDALAFISNKDAVKRSMVLPFRFVTAYKVFSEPIPSGRFESEATTKKKIITALDCALNASVMNLPDIPGKTLILSDNSGSMTGDRGGSSFVSAMSKTTTADIANLFAALYWTRCEDTLVGLFGDRIIYPNMNRELGVLANFSIISESAHKCGGATEAGIYTMFRRMITENMMVDRVIVFSDCQIGDGCNWYGRTTDRRGSFDDLYKQYRKINPDFRMYSVDLKQYGTTVFSKRVFKIFGWSEKIFDIIRATDQDPEALVHSIEQIEL